MSDKCRHSCCLWGVLFLLSIAIALQGPALALPAWLRMSDQQGDLMIGLWQICVKSTENSSTSHSECSSQGLHTDLGILVTTRWLAVGGLVASAITALLSACSTLTLGLRDYQVNLGLGLAAFASGGFVAVAIFGLSGEAHNIAQQANIEYTDVAYGLSVGLEITSVALLWTVGITTVVFALWAKGSSSARKVTGANSSPKIVTLSKIGRTNDGYESSMDSTSMESNDFIIGTEAISPGSTAGWRQSKQKPCQINIVECHSGTNIILGAGGKRIDATNEETQF